MTFVTTFIIVDGELGLSKSRQRNNRDRLVLEVQGRSTGGHRWILYGWRSNLGSRLAQWGGVRGPLLRNPPPTCSSDGEYQSTRFGAVRQARFHERLHRL